MKTYIQWYEKHHISILPDLDPCLSSYKASTKNREKGLKTWELAYSQQPYSYHKSLNHTSCRLGPHTLTENPLITVRRSAPYSTSQPEKATLSRQNSLCSIKISVSFLSQALLRENGLGIEQANFYGGVQECLGFTKSGCRISHKMVVRGRLHWGPQSLLISANRTALR